MRAALTAFARTANEQTRVAHARLLPVQRSHQPPGHSQMATASVCASGAHTQTVSMRASLSNVGAETVWAARQDGVTVLRRSGAPSGTASGAQTLRRSGALALWRSGALASQDYAVLACCHAKCWCRVRGTSAYVHASVCICCAALSHRVQSDTEGSRHCATEHVWQREQQLKHHHYQLGELLRLRLPAWQLTHQILLFLSPTSYTYTPQS